VRDLAILFLHLLATVVRLAGPGGARSVVAESVLVKHQLLILNRSRKRSPVVMEWTPPADAASSCQAETALLKAKARRSPNGAYDHCC